MNSRERVLSAMQGKPFDRRPWSMLLSLYGAKLTGCPLDRYYTDPEAYACGQSAVLEILKPDILFSPFAVVAEGEAFGSRAKYFERHAPNLREPAVQSPEELAGRPVPDVDSSPRLLYIREALRRLVAEHGRAVSVAAVLLTPVDLPIMIMGINAWLDTVIFNRDGAKRVLEKTTPFFIKWARALLKDGADVLVMPASFINPTIVTREIAESFALPALREAFAEVPGPVILHHAGAPFLDFMELFSEMPSVAGFVIDHTDSRSTAREKAGADKVILGGLDILKIEREAPENIFAQCREILSEQRNEPRYILSSSGPDIIFDTPVENIQAVLKAAEAAP